MNIRECPRDAMQGIHDFIPTQEKINYINTLLKVGFNSIDFGSFVSPKAIPQMRDTAEVLQGLDVENSNSKLLAIVANERGAENASSFEEISYLGYPFSISETFQLRNTNATIDQSLGRLEKIKSLTDKSNKELLVYLSMAFGNPYGDKWNVEIVSEWVEKVKNNFGITNISLADTIGVSEPENITYLFSNLIKKHNDVQFEAHLHSNPNTWREKLEALVKTGCSNIDGAILGFGGCPMAKDDLVGNMATEKIIEGCKELGTLNEQSINEEALKDSLMITNQLFSKYH